MKESLRRVKKLQDMIVGLEMQINIFRQDLNIADYNLTILRRAEEDLLFNISFLKREKIIAVVTEYKKSVDDLKHVRKKIKNITNQRIGIVNKLDQYVNKFNRYVEDFEWAKKVLEKEKVVLVFDPSKKRKKSEE